MRTMVILAVLFASLLVVTGVAFATSCPSCSGGQLVCYIGEATEWITNITEPLEPFSICFKGPDTSFVCVAGAVIPVDLFQGLNLRALGSDMLGHAIYMTFHGSHNDAFNGLYNVQQSGFLLHGVAGACP